MTMRASKMIPVFIAAAAISGCLFGQEGRLLRAPMSANPIAGRHNNEGIQAYNQGQMEAAKQRFEEAIKASPTLAEAHYNLGMVLHKMGLDGEANPHFMKAANLEPGNEVIMSSPPLRGVQMPSKSFGATGSDGHGHSH